MAMNSMMRAEYGIDLPAVVSGKLPINAPGMGRFKLFDLVGYS